MSYKYLKKILNKSEPITITYCNYICNAIMYYACTNRNSSKIYPIITNSESPYGVYADTETSKTLRKYIYELIRGKVYHEKTTMHFRPNNTTSEK